MEKNKKGLYWNAPGRNYRRNLLEKRDNAHLCPKCRAAMKRRLYKKMERNKYLLVCPNSECLVVIKYENVMASKKTAVRIDLNRLKDALYPRFRKVELLDDDLLEVKNLGTPRYIYINASGEIWSNQTDEEFKNVKTLNEANRAIRSLAASKSTLFKFSEIKEIFNCKNEPKLLENPIQKYGNEIVSDILKEPDIIKLKLSSEEEDELAEMVFGEIIASKENELSLFDTVVSKSVVKLLNDNFENLKFSNFEDNIEIYYNNKLAEEEYKKEDFSDFLKEACKELKIRNFYESVSVEFSKKVSIKLPDFFRIRDAVLKEVKDQIEGSTHE